MGRMRADQTLQVRQCWGGTVLDVRAFPASIRRITISAVPGRADLLVPTAPGGARAFPLIAATAFGPTLSVPAGARGHLRHPDGREEGIDAAFGPVALPAGGRVEIVLGGLALQVAQKPAAPGVLTRLWDRLDTTWLNSLLFVAVAAVALVATIRLRPAAIRPPDEELHKVPDRYVRFILEHPRPERPLTLSGTLSAAFQADDGGPAAQRLRGDEGEAGQLDRVRTNRRTAVRGTAKDDARVVAGSGLVGALASAGPGGFLPGIGGPSLGSDLTTAIGQIDGPLPGASGGRGGWGLKGDGPGGGMDGQIIGGAEVRTNGRGGGNRDYGRLRRRPGSRPQERPVDIRHGPLNVIGPLSMDLIRQVIDAHRSQIRYCYSQTLIRHPDAEGRISVRFTIGHKGYVTQAGVSQSTMNDAELERCITARARTWKFPAPRGGGSVIVNYPFLFRVPGQ